MENKLNTLKEKIELYNQKASGNKIDKDKSELLNAKEEIETLKRRIKEINNSMKDKSKIEQMKMTLEISSIESEIKVKTLELEDIEEKIEKNYKEKVSSYNGEIANLQEDIKRYISVMEREIEDFVKNSSSGKGVIVSNKDLEDIKGYYKNIMSIEVKELKEVNKKIEDFDQRIANKKYDYDNARSNMQACSERASYWARKDPVTLFGNYDEDKADEYQENMEDALQDMENYSNEAGRIKGEMEKLEKEKTKLSIQKKSHDDKIATVEKMIDEMIKEIVKQEVNKKQIVLPKFVPQCKYL